MLPIEDYVTTDDGVRLFVQKLGNGPQMVVIPNGFYLLDDFKHLAASRTLIFFDLRNRGRSDHVSDGSKLKRSIHHDVDDLEAVRRHFEIGQMELLGHSYVGLLAILYAMKYAAYLNRVVQIGPMDPFHGKQYAAHLTCADDTQREVFAKLAQLPERAWLRRAGGILQKVLVGTTPDLRGEPGRRA